MAQFRKLKSEIRSYLGNKEGQDFSLSTLPKSLKEVKVEQWISPLFACLPETEPLTTRAAQKLGYAVSQIFLKEKEKARIIMRRLIWQMNEESGNIGWGLPVAFAQCLVHSKELAQEYHRILISYIYDRDGDSNYCDFAPLRVSCFDAVELLLDKYPKYIENARIPLLQGINDTDSLCQKKAEVLVIKYRLSDV